MTSKTPEPVCKSRWDPVFSGYEGIIGALGFLVDCNNPPDAVLGTPYSHFILAISGTPPYIFSITAGALPDGLSLDSATGEISGTPTMLGPFSFTVQAQDSKYQIRAALVTTGVDDMAVPTQGFITGHMTTSGLPVCTIPNGGILEFVIQVNTGSSVTDPIPTLVYDALNLANAGNGMSFDTASGAITFGADLVATIVSGTGIGVTYPIPTSLALDDTVSDVPGAAAAVDSPDGVLASGTWDFSPTRATAECAIVVSTSAVDCNNPPGGTVGVPYSHEILTVGGTPPFTFSITAGALPDGLSIDPATGIISGTPTLPGTFVFTVTATGS